MKIKIESQQFTEEEFMKAWTHVHSVIIILNKSDNPVLYDSMIKLLFAFENKAREVFSPAFVQAALAELQENTRRLHRRLETLAPQYDA